MTAPLLQTLRAIALAPPLYALICVLGTVSLAWNLIAAVLYPLLPPAVGRKLGRASIAHIYRTFWALASACRMMRVDAACLDALQDEPGLIFVANHPTMLDALLLVAHLPRSACIMKASLMRNIFLGAGARLARYICNDSARKMVRLAVEDLRAGGQLVLFPEGTRTTEWPLNRFKPGVTLISKRANAPIQTVFLDTDTPYVGKGWPIWRVPPLPVVFRLRLGERFAPAQDSDAQLARLEQYFRQHTEARIPDAQAACPTSRAATLS